MALMLRMRGYWTHQSFKVALTREDKHAIGRPSSPRWELDLVAYKGSTNEVLAVECKSFLDSPGVTFDGTSLQPTKSYKLFTEERTRTVVLRRLAAQLTESGTCAPSPTVTLCLAAGKLRHPGREAALASYLSSNGWRFFGPGEIATQLATCKSAAYENDIAYVTAKLLLRTTSRQP